MQLADELNISPEEMVLFDEFDPYVNCPWSLI